MFLINESTDQELFSQTLSEAQARLQSAKPTDAQSAPVVFTMASMRWRELRRLLRALAIAATPSASGAQLR